MSEKIYVWLLRLYPKEFRREYGPAILRLFRDRLHAEQGPAIRARLWLDLIADLAVSVPREHLRSRPASELSTREYCLSDAAVTAMFRRTVLGPAVSFYVFILIGVAAGRLEHASPVLISLAYGLLATRGLAKIRDLRHFKQRWRSFELVLGTDCVQRSRCGRHSILMSNEVKRIVEDGPGLFIVAAGGKGMFIPAELNGYVKVRAHLNEWMPVTQYAVPHSSFVAVRKSGASPLLAAILLTPAGMWFLALSVLYGICVLPIAVSLWRTIHNVTPQCVLKSEKRFQRSGNRRQDAFAARRVLQALIMFLTLLMVPMVRAVVVYLEMRPALIHGRSTGKAEESSSVGPSRAIINANRLKSYSCS